MDLQYIGVNSRSGWKEWIERELARPYRPGEAGAIVELLKRDRNQFDPSELHRLLGWEL